MGAIETLRDALFGNPPSQTTEPSREGVLKAFEETVQSINSVVGGIFTEDASAVYATRATLFSNLGFPDRTLGVVYADPNSDYLGIYVKSGVSGSGGWNFTGLLGRGPGPTDEQIYLAYEEYVDQISADVITAQTAASAALAAAGVGKYDDTADGLVNTSLGETFWVDLGNGLGQVYRHDAGPVATVLQKFIIDPSDSGAAAVIGTIQTGTGAAARTLEDVANERQSVAGRNTLANALSVGLPVLFNAGSRTLQTTAAVAAGTQLYGDGDTATETTVQATAGLPNLYGFTVASNSAITDQGIVLDKNGQTWAAGIGFASPASNIRIERVTFSSAGVADGTYGLYIDGEDVSDVLVDGMVADAIALPQIKSNSDNSVQTRWTFTNYRATGCVDGFNINSPVGEFSYGRVEGWADTSTQFPYAFAGPGCFAWEGLLRGNDNDYEMVHIEDAASRLNFRVVGERNNLEPGTPGSPASANGTVSIIGGANAVDLSLALDLTQNAGGSPGGVAIQASGPRVSDGLVVVPFNVTIAGNVKGGAGDIAVIAIEAVDRIIADHLSLESEAGDAMSPALSIPGSNLGGEVYIKTPGVVFEGNDNTPMTGLDTLVLSDVTSDFTDWTDGVTTDRTAIQITQLLKLTMDFTADIAATWQPVMPVFRDCRVKAAWKFNQNGAANGALVMCDEFIVESGALIPTPVIVRAGGSADPIPGHAAAVTPTGDTASGSFIVTNLSALTGVAPGYTITGTGIPAGTKVLTILSSTSVCLDRAATATNAGTTLTIRTPPTTDLCWRVNSGMLECHIYNSSTANGTLSLVMQGLMTA